MLQANTEPNLRGLRGYTHAGMLALTTTSESLLGSFSARTSGVYLLGEMVWGVNQFALIAFGT